MSDSPSNTPHTASGTPNGGRPDYDDEISLIDLLVVLIRRRKLVIGLPLLAGLLSGLWLFVVPALLPDLAGPGAEYEIRLSAELRRVPEELQSIVNFDAVSNARAVLGDINVVGAAYAEVFPESRAERSQEQFNSYIRREVVGNKLAVNFETGTGLLTVNYTNTELEPSLQFLELLMDAARSDLRARLERRLEDAERGLERSLESRREQLETTVAHTLRTRTATADMTEADIARLVVDSAQLSISAFAEAQNALQELELIYADERFPLGGSLDPVVFGDALARGRSVRLVVTVFAVFFLAVFLAFVLEYARRVQEDPEESAKIKAAWRGE